MKDQLISFETAILAKEKGFDQNPFKIKDAYGPRYTDGSNIRLRSSSLFSPETNTCVAPTQSLLQKWLREEHGIHIQISFQECGYNYSLSHKQFSSYPMKGHYAEIPYYRVEHIEGESSLRSYEVALEKGLQEALNLI